VVGGSRPALGAHIGAQSTRIGDLHRQRRILRGTPFVSQ
jgi:hypothetical protein